MYRYKDGGVYEGEWQDNKKHGRGLLKYANGSVYEGEFKNGVADGKGTMKWKAGTEYAVNPSRNKNAIDTELLKAHQQDLRLIQLAQHRWPGHLLRQQLLL